MKITKKKAKSVLRKALTGVKKGYGETSKFVGYYGPKVHRYTGSVASSISQGMTPPPRLSKKQSMMKPIRMRKPVKIKMMPSGRRKMSRMRKNNVDWSNIGVNL